MQSVVVVQLAETQEDLGSNPAINNFRYICVLLYVESTKLKKKECY